MAELAAHRPEYCRGLDRKNMLKVELHSHTADDPLDRIAHSTTDLIDRAAALGYDALAITLHDRQLDITHLVPYAADRGIVLIPGIARTVQGRHVLLLNFRGGTGGGTEAVQTFEDVRRLKRDGARLIVAPHPFFPSRKCLLGAMNRHADLFDAVECNGMFTSTMNFNKAAERWAARHGKPMVGNGDVHCLEQLGSTYSLVDAPKNADAICHAVAAGRVTVVSQPHTWPTAIRIMARIVLPHLAGHRRDVPSPAYY